MKWKDDYKELHLASEDCSRCGIYVDSYELIGCLGLHPGEIARTITDDEVHHYMSPAVQRCDLRKL